MKEIFATARLKDDLAIIVAQHLDVAGKKLALESLRSITKQQVVELKSGTRIVPGTIYTVPPQTLVEFEDGMAKLSPTHATAKKLKVIDHLFKSIAHEFKATTIGVILSGDANDGAEGVMAINSHGGITIAQSLETSEHRSMPENAILTGAVDHVLAPKAMWAEIQSYAAYIQADGAAQGLGRLREQIASSLTTICEVLQQKTRHDFKHYKTSTLVRRIQRRMQVLQLDSVDRYLEELQKSPEEIEILFRELLINVTQFFRDREAFQALRDEVLVPLLKNAKPGQKIRIWIAGCSTGEEPYSVAILMRELCEELSHPPEIQIIATDIDDAALAVARKGSYPFTIAERVSPERLTKYFVKRGGKYHVSKELRELCLFSVHNLINDPPFSQVDLISCRNVLIYLGSHLQKKLFPVFHYALRPAGYLFLGSSETVTSHRELFKSLNSRARLAQRKSTAIKLPSISTSVQSYLSHFQESQKITESDLSLIGQRIALDEMPLRYAIVNDEAQILSSSGGLSQYVQIPEGAFQNNIIKLTAPSLRAALRAAFNLARKEKRKITSDTCTLKIESMIERVTVIVQPMPQLGDMSELYWVAFHNLGQFGTSAQGVEVIHSRALTEADGEAFDQLERELSVLRVELDKSVQDLEASNEELKSSNEELLSMNEELQSANEELEASKEEVQNTNDALQRSNSDLENLLQSTQIATLFLDDQYFIKGLTPAIREIYHIQPSDIGRPLADFTSRAVSMPPYPVAQDIHPKAAQEDEFFLANGKIYLRRLLPYKTHEDTRDGIVATFIDVTELRRSEGRFLTLANTVPVITWTTNPSGAVEFFNARWYEYTGQRKDQAEGWGWLSVIHPEDLPLTEEIWKISLATGEPYRTEYRLRRADGEFRWHSATGVSVKDQAEKVTAWFGTCVDIHDRKQRIDAVDNEKANFQNLFKQTPEMVCILRGPQHHFEFANDAHVRILGFSAVGMTVREAQPESVEVHGLLDAVYATGQTAELHEIPVTIGTQLRFFNLTYAARRDVDGKIDGIMILGTEVTEQRTLRDALERTARLIETMPSPFFAVNKNWEINFWNPASEGVVGLKKSDILGRVLWDVFPGLRESDFGAVYLRAMNEKHSTPFDAFYAHYGRWYRAWPFPFEDGVAVSFLDITSQKVVEKELERSKARYELLFNSSPLPKWIVDVETNAFIDVNDVAVRAYGYSRAEFLAMKSDALIADKAPVVGARFERHRRKDGSLIDVEISTLTLVIDEKDLRMSAVVDVTEQNRLMKNERAAKEEAERLLRELEQKSAQLGTILEQMPLSVIFAEAPTGRLLFANQQFQKLWGYDFIPADGVEGYREYVGYHKDGRRYEGGDWPLARALRGEVIFGEDTIIERGDKSRAIFSLTAAPVRNPQGEITAAVVLSEDVTRRREVEEDLRQAKLAAELASESKTRFLANMSHEIRTPLSAIVGFGDLLRKLVAPETEVGALAERISRNSQVLGRLIDELLDLSKIEADKLEVENSFVDVEALMEDVFSTLMLRAQSKGVELNFSWRGPQPKVIMTDQVRLSQILTNIVGNAVKFTEQGSVEVEFEQRAQQLVVRVADTGIGLSNDQKQRIFEPFMQGDASVTRRYGGTGLGLALAKRLCKLLGGDLILERSEPGQGSSFRIEIATNPDVSQAPAPPPERSDSDLLALKLKGKSILVVDDSPDNRALVSMILTPLGVEIDEAVNGADSLEKAQAKHYDLILMDIQMPVMDGYQAISKLKALLPRVPVIALTAHAFKEEKDRCLRAGFSNYVTKPIHRPTLLRSIQNLLD